MKLTVLQNDSVIQELDLQPGQAYRAGRQDSCAIFLDKHPGISREHFEIEQDSNGDWRVNVLSEIKLILFKREERKDFVLQGDGEFFLDPYTFQFSVEGNVFSQSNYSDNPFNAMVGSDVITPADSFADEGGESEEDDFDGDEKTAIQNFSGLPYIKIIGQNGKKSEYFRLEGNLWVVGGHEGASVFLREPAAAQNHFEISKTDKGFFIVDLGSQQGTELNGQKLVAKKPSRLLSGDVITVGSTSLQFELRDKAFKRKVSNIPLNMYKNPLVFFDQDVAMVNLDEESGNAGSAEEIKEQKNNDKQKKLKLYAIAAALLIGMFIANELLPTEENNNNPMKGADPFSQLLPAEQKIVVQTYKLASQLYINKNYELALTQLNKLHDIIAIYKDSKKMEEDCINARDLQRQRALREQQIREQEELEQRVNSAISQCESQYARSDDVEGAKACLVPAADLDPNNPRLAQLITDVTARREEQDIRQKMKAEHDEKVHRGKELYDKAKVLDGQKRWHAAIEAYENHIHSGLPDPNNLAKKSQRRLASIEKLIRTKKQSLLSSAKSNYSTGQYRDAIKLARKAQSVDPYDPTISSFIFQVDKELTSKMKAIYMDSVIEEKFGNLEASRVKWEEIVKIDIEDGEYYLKAKRKLKQYGYKH